MKKGQEENLREEEETFSVQDKQCGRTSVPVAWDKKTRKKNKGKSRERRRKEKLFYDMWSPMSLSRSRL